MIMSEQTQGFLFVAMEFMAALFIIVVGLAVVAIVIIYIFDVTQTKSAIKRNYWGSSLPRSPYLNRWNDLGTSARL